VLPSPFAACLLLAGAAAAQDQAPSEAAERRELKSLERSCYYLIKDEAVEAGKPSGLLVVLPGGDGGADFLPWVQRSLAGCTPSGFLCAMLTAPRWSETQEVVWPTAALPEPGMKYGTEQYVREVVADVAARYKVDKERLVILAWSSGGPAAWELLLSSDNPFGRAYVAMSVFKKQDAKALARAKGLRVVLDQSTEDRTTPFVHAEKAREALGENGAAVRLLSHGGEHGWTDNPLPRVTEGLRWLVSKEPVPAGERKEIAPVKAGKNLVANGGFEDGWHGWIVSDNSKKLGVYVDKEDLKEGKASLHVTKSGALPLDLVRQEFKLPGSGRVTIGAWVKCKSAINSLVKLFVYDAAGKVLNDPVDVVHLGGDKAWQRVEKTWEVTGAARGVLQIVMIGAGEVWVDAVEVRAAK
jgi:predicted esterase